MADGKKRKRPSRTNLQPDASEASMSILGSDVQSTENSGMSLKSDRSKHKPPHFRDDGIERARFVVNKEVGGKRDRSMDRGTHFGDDGIERQLHQHPRNN